MYATTGSLITPGLEVWYKQYHTGEIIKGHPSKDIMLFEIF